MSRKEVEFLVKMILSETTELLETVCEDMDECRQVLQRCMGIDTHEEISTFETDDDVCAGQADALIDIMYYILNAASKKSMNLDHVFQEVHQANMAKRDPLTGKFIIRESDGKILKPTGWQPPDVKKALFLSEQTEQQEHVPRHRLGCDATNPCNSCLRAIDTKKSHSQTNK